ncbi:unnamed protein product [Rotaria sordida]|uniref:Uncharacterized protein n=1 Tax=Rotaria sordida TaxID=392033 RepID=A0A814PNH7_9BILA|nr:unnamed protein product [Rotaria sordida]CAF1038715.1 unnamed protein product [Rotaria sordida]CAF1108440.1 unnamed protein product [Rotaria sordida]CAF1319188.1 unnamed protein product [Rotaria sordida]CAF3539260.1 unnamed protein product [Rotaria sordida]
MNSNRYPSPMQDRNTLSASSTTEIYAQHPQRKENLTTKVRQTINARDKRIRSHDGRKLSTPDMTTLTPQSQELILHAFETIRNEDSINLMTTLDESRDMLRNSYDEFQREQDKYKKQLEEITRNKELAMQRRKENAIPISLFLRQKHDIRGLADLRPNSGMNATYQAYFEALLTPNQNQQQHPSDKAAVIKYIRRRERQRRAEENRKTCALSADVFEKQTSDIIEKMSGMDVKLENERERQNNLLRTKMNEKITKTQNIIEVGQIIDQAHEANLARERVEQKHREKMEARLSAARNQQSQTPTNMIHVQSHLNDDDDDNNRNFELNDEQRAATKNSIQLLNNNNDGYKAVRSITPVYGNEDSNEKIANIYI